MSKIKDILRNPQRWTFITVLYKRRLRVLFSCHFQHPVRLSRTCGRRPFTRNHLTSFKECHYFPPNWAKQVISKKHWTKNSWKYRSSDVLKNFQNLVYSCCLTQFGGPARSLKPLDGASVHFTEGSRNLLSYYVLLARFTETLNIRLNDSQWLQIVKSRHKISSFDVISRVFQNNFSKIYNYLRLREMSFILKSCRIVAGASTYDPFHEFLKSIFSGFLQFGPALRLCAFAWLLSAISKQENRKLSKSSKFWQKWISDLLQWVNW